MATAPISKPVSTANADINAIKRESAVKRVQDIVYAWIDNTIAKAPAPHHRDRGEFIAECLPELVEQLVDGLDK